MDIFTTNTNTTSDVTIKVPLTLMFTSRAGLKLKPQSAPTATEGLLYYDKSMHILRYRNNTSWLNLTLELGAANDLADKRIPPHIGTGGYRPTDTEHKYLGYNGATNAWKQWSNDGFLDFRIPQTINTPIKFNGAVDFTQDINMSGRKLVNVRYPELPTDTTTKQYVDTVCRAATANDRGPIGDRADALLKTLIDQINHDHALLNALWEGRKAFINNGTQYSTNPADPTYWSGAGLKQAMITATRRLKSAGTI